MREGGDGGLQLEVVSAALWTPVAATATASIGTTATDVNETRGVNTGEASNGILSVAFAAAVDGSLSVASARAFDAPPASLLAALWTAAAATATATVDTTLTDADGATAVNTGEASYCSLPVASATALDAQSVCESAGFKTAPAATATAAVGTPPTDDDEARDVKPGDAEDGTLLAASASPAGVAPADV